LLPTTIGSSWSNLSSRRLTVELMPCDRTTGYLYSSRSRGFVPMADCGTPPQIVQRFAEKFFFGRSRAVGKRESLPFRDELVAGRFGYATRDDAATPEVQELLESSSSTPSVSFPCARARAARSS
jgi:hypothetical protein